MREYEVVVENDPLKVVKAKSAKLAGLRVARSAGFEPLHLQEEDHGLLVKVRSKGRTRFTEFRVHTEILVRWLID
jgi:hypothetical protein